MRSCNKNLILKAVYSSPRAGKYFQFKNKKVGYTPFKLFLGKIIAFVLCSRGSE